MSTAVPMTPPSALVADDEENLSRHLVGRLAALWPELRVLPPVANGLDALRVIDDESPDVAFLDIRMPGLSGLDVSQRIDRRTHVVFVTAYDEYAVEAFDRNALDYILKPVTDERLARCIERLKGKLAKHEAPAALDEVIRRIAGAIPGGGTRLRWIRALKGEVVHQIPVDEVRYFQASDKYTCVMAREGESLIRMALADLVPQLDGEQFWQIHRSTVVNMEEVATTRRDVGGRVFVKLKDGTELAVSRAYSHLFKQM